MSFWDWSEEILVLNWVIFGNGKLWSVCWTDFLKRGGLGEPEGVYVELRSHTRNFKYKRSLYVQSSIFFQTWKEWAEF